MTASRRVHELAKEFNVPSVDVLNRLRALGEFVRSPSSLVSPWLEERLRTSHAEDPIQAGEDPTPVPSSPLHRSNAPRPPIKTNMELEAERRQAEAAQWTPEWESQGFDAAGRALWQREGLGNADAALAKYLVSHGVWPEDLRLTLRGRPAWTRFREGETSRYLLTRELLEVRSSIPKRPRELPSKQITRRYKSPPPPADDTSAE